MISSQLLLVVLPICGPFAVGDKCAGPEHFFSALPLPLCTPVPFPVKGMAGAEAGTSPGKGEAVFGMPPQVPGGYGLALPLEPEGEPTCLLECKRSVCLLTIQKETVLQVYTSLEITKQDEPLSPLPFLVLKCELVCRLPRPGHPQGNQR